MKVPEGSQISCKVCDKMIDLGGGRGIPFQLLVRGVLYPLCSAKCLEYVARAMHKKGFEQCTCVDCGKKDPNTQQVTSHAKLKVEYYCQDCIQKRNVLGNKNIQ